MTQPEFSRLFDLTQANEKPADVTYDASAEEMAALAKRFQVASLSGVTAALAIAPHALGHHITGTVKASAQQSCVVTGDALERAVEGAISYLAISMSVDVDLDSIEEAYGVSEADLVDGSEIDAGELAAQYLGLAIDPFPRAPGASLDPEVAGEKQNPFAVLAQLKDKA